MNRIIGIWSRLSMFCWFFSIGCDSDDADPPMMVDCNATGPVVTLAVSNSNCGADDGTIALNISGGNGNLMVTIDPQPSGVDFANNTFTNVEPGNYLVEVTDQDNCSSSSSVAVEFTPSNISYAGEIDAIIQADCALPACHDGSDASLANFTIFSELQSLANNQPGGVRDRVKSGDMPRGSETLEPNEIAAILCWVDEGAQDN